MAMLHMLTFMKNDVPSSTEGKIIEINDNSLLNKEEMKNGVKLEIVQMNLVE